MTTRMDPARDTTIIENTTIDYLDFASPVSGLGGKIGLDATHKWRGETQRDWGKPISMSAAVKEKIDGIWDELGILKSIIGPSWNMDDRLLEVQTLVWHELPN